MRSASLRRGSQTLQVSMQKSKSSARTFLFGQYAGMRGLTSTDKWESVYLLLSTKDLSFTASRSDQAYPIEVIRFEDIEAVVNPQVGARRESRRRRGSAFESLFRRESVESKTAEAANDAQRRDANLDYMGQEDTTFAVLTDPAGYYLGRTFYFRAADRFSRDLWVAYVSLVCGSALDTLTGEKSTQWSRFVRRLRLVYTGKRAQSLVGMLVSQCLLLPPSAHPCLLVCTPGMNTPCQSYLKPP